MFEEIIQYVTDADMNVVVYDGLDEAVIGVDEVNERLVYSFEKIISVLINDGMTHEEAIEYYDYNIGGLHIGERTPIIVKTFLEIN